MTEAGGSETSPQSAREQLEKAVRDLWAMPQEAGDRYVVFLDRRRLRTRVEQDEDGQFRVSWETEDGQWLSHEQCFENPREAAFHAYQGPH